MKKSLIALAVAGAMTAPMMAQADATLYGLVEVRLQSFEDADVDLAATKTQIGITGTVDNDVEGLETGYQIEWRFNAGAAGAEESTSSADVQLRKSHVWMAGDWGRADFGQQNNPAEVGTWSVTNRNNAIFINTADRINNAAVYYTPKMGGFQAMLGVSADGGRGKDVSKTSADFPTGKDGDDVDLVSFGATYSANGLAAGFGYMDIESTSDSDAAKDGREEVSANVRYTMNGLTGGVAYFDRDEDGGSAGDFESFLVGVNYSMGAASVHAEYTEKDVDTQAGSFVDDDMTAVGVRYRLGAKAMVQVEYADFDKSSDNLIVEYQLNF